MKKIYLGASLALLLTSCTTIQKTTKTVKDLNEIGETIFNKKSKNQKIKKLNPVDSLTIFNYDKLEYNDIKLSPLKNKKAYNQHYSSKNNWQKLTQTITKEKNHFNLSNANNFKLVSIIEGIENDYFFISTLHIYPYSDALNGGLFVYSEDKKKMFKIDGQNDNAMNVLFDYQENILKKHKRKAKNYTLFEKIFQKDTLIESTTYKS